MRKSRADVCTCHEDRGCKELPDKYSKLLIKYNELEVQHALLTEQLDKLKQLSNHQFTAFADAASIGTVHEQQSLSTGNPSERNEQSKHDATTGLDFEEQNTSYYSVKSSESTNTIPFTFNIPQDITTPIILTILPQKQ